MGRCRFLRPHPWEPVAAKQFNREHRQNYFDYSYGSWNTKPALTPHTRVLERCARCGTARSIELKGHWTLAQILGWKSGDDVLAALDEDRVS